jgi:hypothetical protein
MKQGNVLVEMSDSHGDRSEDEGGNNLRNIGQFVRLQVFTTASMTMRQSSGI